MMLVLRHLVFARLDHPAKGTPEQQRRARECLFPNHLYRVEVVEQTGIQKIQFKAKDGRTLQRSQHAEEWKDTKITVALKGVKYWWPESMFVFFDADGNPYDLRLMTQKTMHTQTYYYGRIKNDPSNR